MMKMPLKTVAKVIGYGAGALLGGPVFGWLGATCGGFIGQMLEDEGKGGWGGADGLKGLCGNLLASRMEPWLADAHSEFNHDLRRAAATALVKALDWDKSPGPLATALLKTDGFSTLDLARKDLLKRVVNRWQKHLQTELKKAVAAENAAALETLLPPVDDEALAAFADGKLSAEQQTRQAWAQFYTRALQPALQTVDCQRDLKQLQIEEAKLQKQTTECLASVFPAAFMVVVKTGDHQKAWIAYQKTLLTAIQRAVRDIGTHTQRLPEIEQKLDALLSQDAAQSELNQRLETFLTTVEAKVDGTYENTEIIKTLIIESRQSIEGKLDRLSGEMKRQVGKVRRQVGKVGKGVKKVHRRVDEAHDKLDKLIARKPLNQYLSNLNRRFAKHNALGIPAVADTKQKQGPDQIVDLFVQPTCTTERLRPEDLPGVMENANRQPKALLQRFGMLRRVVLLADPGMGKTTLIQWLVVALCAPMRPAEVQAFGRAIPLPFILRDIVHMMPANLMAWRWPALVQAFLKHQLDKDQPGMAWPLADDEDTLRDVLDSPYAWFLIDGLDEVGDEDRRKALRKALWEGFEAHPKARFLITSRVVGYKEAQVHLEVMPVTIIPRDHVAEAVGTGVQSGRDDDACGLFTSIPPDHVAESAGTGRQSGSDDDTGGLLFSHAELLYLAPWNNRQQSEFAQNWFVLRFGDSDGRVQAGKFVRAVHDHPGTSSIGRVPNLLLLMALLYRYRADLPHGRAKVYSGISQAYLENISVVRRIQHRDVPYTLAQKERLLAVIAMHMQVRRTAGGTGKTSQKEDEAKEVLASRKDLEDWLCPEFGRKTDAENVKEMEAFIAHIADCSGLLLPRGVVNGVEQFAFAHLSFQEYYAACWLELEFSRLLNLRVGGDDLLGGGTPAPALRNELAMTGPLFAERAAQTSWREPLLFLAEKISERPPDVGTLRKWLFPIRSGDKKPLPMPAQQLLAALSLDPQVSFNSEEREAIWRHLCRAHLKNDSIWEGSVAPALLVPSDHQVAVLATLVRLAAETEAEWLSLKDCGGVNDLSALQGLSTLKKLDLTRCTGVSDLEALRGLSSLRTLDLSRCTGVRDLRALQELSELQMLLLWDCTGLSDLGPLQGLRNLQHLHLSGCTAVSDLSPLQGLSKLGSLDLTGCTGVCDLGAIQGLTSLEHLYLRDCTGVSDVTVLYGFRNLRSLDLEGCTGLRDREGVARRLMGGAPLLQIGL